MSTDTKQWRVFRCPSCEALLKLPKDSKARALKCPKCTKTVRIPAQAEADAEAASVKNQAPDTEPAPAADSPAASLASAPSAATVEAENSRKPERQPGDVIRAQTSGVLPDQRDLDPTPEGLRETREDRENWETNRHKRKKLDFSDKLASTEDDEIKADPNAEPEVRRKRFVGGKESQESTHSWDDDGGGRGKSSNLPMIIMIVALVLIAAVALLGMGLLKDDASPSLANTDRVANAFGIDLANSMDVSEFHEEVSGVIKNFLEAKTVDELVGYVRRPERVGPLLRQYYGIHTYEPWQYKALPASNELMHHKKYIVAVIQLDAEDDSIGAIEQSRIIALEQTEDGFKVDWESWVGYSEISWELFKSQRMTDPYEFRALVGRDNYYNFKYQDFMDWRCYQIRDPEEEYRFWGYVGANSEVDKALQRALLRTPYTYAVVRLRYPTGNPLDVDGRQVEIVELIEEGWVKREDNDYNPEDQMLDGSFDFRDRR